jgi:Ca2+-binding EF-hand superfamily protein
MAARKTLSHIEDLQSKLEQKDLLGDGILSRELAQALLEEAKVPDLASAEVMSLINFVDTTHKGFVNPAVFTQRLVQLATESKADVMLRRFANVTKQGINLSQELAKLDNRGSGRLDRRQFYRALKQLSLSLTDDEIALLWEAGEGGEFLEIKSFVTRVLQARKLKAPAPLKAQATSKTATTGKGGAAQTGFGQ